jgi:hypothetical protein
MKTIEHLCDLSTLGVELDDDTARAEKCPVQNTEGSVSRAHGHHTLRMILFVRSLLPFNANTSDGTLILRQCTVGEPGQPTAG